MVLYLIVVAIETFKLAVHDVIEILGSICVLYMYIAFVCSLCIQYGNLYQFFPSVLAWECYLKSNPNANHNCSLKMFVRRQKLTSVRRTSA